MATDKRTVIDVANELDSLSAAACELLLTDQGSSRLEAVSVVIAERIPVVVAEALALLSPMIQEARQHGKVS